MLVWIFLMNTRSKLGLHAQTLATKPQPLEVLFFLLANEARTKNGACRAHVVKGHVNNSWYRLRPLSAVPLVVRRRYLIEVPSSLIAAPLVARRTVPWPLRRCASRVLSRGAQADARGATHVLDRGGEAVTPGSCFRYLIVGRMPHGRHIKDEKKRRRI